MTAKTILFNQVLDIRLDDIWNVCDLLDKYLEDRNGSQENPNLDVSVSSQWSVADH